MNKQNKNYRMFKSLRFKFTFIIVVLIVLVLGISSTFILIDKRQYLHQNLLNKAILFGAYTPSSIYESYGGYYVYQNEKDLEQFRYVITNILKKNKDIVHLTLLNTNGKILFDSSEFNDGWYTGDSRQIDDEEILANIVKLEERVKEGETDPMWGRKIISQNHKALELYCPINLESYLTAVVIYHVSLDNIKSEIIKTTSVILGITLILMVAGVIFAILLSNFIIGPIRKVSDMMITIAKEKDFTKLLKIERNDEIGRLADAFNQMVGNLSTLLQKTVLAVQQLNITSQDLTISSQEQASGIHEQSSSIAETTTAARQLSKSAEMVGNNIQKVIDSTDHALKGMIDIKSSIGITSEKVATLNEKSQKIGSITQLIDDIADKTNLLAINAAIEAARAGEQGSGFTVVADEIRKLSDSTAKSTRDINALIEVIQNETSNAIIAMDESVGNVDNEMSLSQDSVKHAKEISMSSVQQMGGARQIAEAMGGINESMKQVTIAASRSKEVADELKSLAKELLVLASNFKINTPEGEQTKTDQE